MKKKRRHIFLSSVAGLLFLVSAGLAWLLLSHGSPPSEAELADKPHRLTVLTWNTARMAGFKKAAQNEVLLFLANQNAEVVCLQEVDVYKDARYLTLAEVKEAMGKKYPYSYIDFSIYDKRHQFGTMVWSKYPLINKQSIRFQPTANLSNRCDIVVGKDTIRLINNHLQSYSFTASDISEAEQQRNYEGFRSSARRLEKKWKHAMPLRNAQARAVREEVDRSPYPVIVAGDLNSIPTSYVYFQLKRGMHDAWAETSWFRWGATCEKRHRGVRIDYILSSKTLVPTRCQVHPLNGSDHHPVEATLAW